MYGVIDIGSNTIRLVIYKIEKNHLKPMINKKYTAGLAGYIESDGNMSQKGIQILVNTLLELRQIIQNINVQEIFLFGTASLRNSANTQEILTAVKKYCGFDIQVLSGEQEATFDYYGVIQNPVHSNGLLVDIGGGSTELVFFQNNEIVHTDSLPIGSLNLFNRFVADIIPTAEEVRDIKREVKRQLQSIDLPEDSELHIQPTIYGVGGTARAAAKIIASLTGEAAGQLREYSCEKLKFVLSKLETDEKEVVRSILKVVPERVHTIVPGMTTLKTISGCYNTKNIITSNYGVREGYLHFLLKKRGILV